MDYHDFKCLLLVLIKLLAACHFLDELLHDDSVIIVSLARCDLQMIHGGEYDTAAGRGGCGANFVFFLLASDFVHRVGIVESLQHSLGQCPLARS